MRVCEKSVAPRANSEVEWKYLSDLLSSLLLSGGGRADWHLRAAFAAALLCHRLWAPFACCLRCFSLSWQVASCDGNAKGRGRRVALGNALVTGVMKDVGKVRACSFPRCRGAVDGTAQSNSIFI